MEKSDYVSISKNLNRASQKDNYPVPSMEHILQCVSESEMLSLLDGLSGYNQVLVSNGDQLKTTFNTEWGTYAYRKMPFGLINVGTTFHRAMDIIFRGLINRSVVVYMDDITVYSYRKRDHIYHLKHIFERCRRYEISLNPKKSVLTAIEGRLLGHILSKEGIIIYPERIETIMRIQLPANKRAMHLFSRRLISLGNLFQASRK